MLRRYVLARILAGLFGLLVFITITFFVTKLLVPGDITSNLAPGTPGRQRLREALGLTEPLWRQYLLWIGSVLSLNFGRNPGGATVLDQLLRALPWTLAMFAIGLGSAFWVGVKIGRWAGWRKGGTTPTTLGAATVASVFPPWLVFLAFYTTLNLFGFRFFNEITALEFDLWDDGIDEHRVLWAAIGTIGLLVTIVLLGRRLIPRRRIRRWWTAVSLPLVPLVAVYLWRQSGTLSHTLDLLLFLILPVLVLFLLAIGGIILVVAASMDGLADSDFAITAKAKGLTDAQVRKRHAGRVVLLPALSRLTANLPFALGGLVIIEASFGRLGGYRIAIPGVASVLFGSLRQRDVLLTMGGLVIVGILTLLLRIGLDLTVASIDPRVQLEKPARA
jgi:peptide/nickel transport system permease protein